MKLLEALQYIHNHGNLLYAPCSDAEVPVLFAKMFQRGYLRSTKQKIVLTRVGFEALKSENGEHDEE